ncbi:MAG TPA: hypothetical protein VD884_14320 [Ohtaekwangia sp.]|nr:hypothetical protein [Ohtaekwangia sp.]
MNQKHLTINRIKGLLQHDTQDDHFIIHNMKAYKTADVDIRNGFTPMPGAKGIKPKKNLEVYKVRGVSIAF